LLISFAIVKGKNRVKKSTYFSKIISRIMYLNEINILKRSKQKCAIPKELVEQ